MKIGKRNLSQCVKALFARKHYIAFINIFLICHKPFDCFKRYFFGSGTYPTKIALRTPLGKINTTIYSYHDMLTINEIFCRVDYKVKNDINVVVDIGSNIGISALFFLTRNDFCKCYLFEPDPDNVFKLNDNLKKFKNRYTLEECAVDNETGIKQFGKDPFGRYGGLNRKYDDYINVRCCHINDVLRKILQTHDLIDILKIDIEGNEIEVLQSIDEKILRQIKNIYFEIDHSINLDSNFSFHPEIFLNKRSGEMFTLINKSTIL